MRLEALIELSRELAAEHDPWRLLDNVCRTARRIIGSKYAMVGIADEAGAALDHLSTSGMDAETVARLRPALAQQGRLSVLRAAPQAYRQSDLHGDAQAVGLPPEHPPIQTFMGVPLRTATQVYGWLCLTDRLGAEAFSAEDERLAISLAAHAALAYENARRYDEIQRHTIELEQRVTERTAALQRSNAELEQFAYVASHDLQAPLHNVLGFATLLNKHHKDQLDGEAKEFLGFVIDGATRMRQLIQDLLTYSRLGWQGHAFVPVNCEDVLSWALGNLQTVIAESAAVITHEPLPTVLADAGQLVQLVQNLLSNAIKFRGTQPPHVHVAATRAPALPTTGDGGPATEWVFTVRDNGIGIEPQYTERIFRVFQRLHNREQYPGTGIGLAICKKVLEHHSGRIWVESQPGQGTTFYFTLPERA